MDAVKFIEERNRMCKSFGDKCTRCPAFTGLCCVLDMQSTMDATAQIDIIENWAAAHPRRTRQSVFLEQYPVRKAKVVYVHPKGRYIVAECKGVRETFFPEDIIQCDLPGPPPMDYELKEALTTLTEVDKKIMAALGML